ncbi:universal stress protein [Dactylosporangium cerinum]|uniref:Universal stress protein n=1 Tax=Dactylosporangium cerinum TaxID=1434730 RepID=A0ABV9W1S5_9ACTN
MTSTATGVVVGVDGSDDSHHAVQWAAADAARRRVPLQILHACGGPQLRYPPPGLALPVAAGTGAGVHAERLLADAAVRALDVSAELTVTTELVAGRPVPALLTASQDAAAVVVGGRGRGGFTGLLVGSTGAQLADHAACPVVVVRPRTGPAGPNESRVVVGVDGSPSAQRALGFAVEQATLRRCGLTAVHAYQVPVPLEADGIAPDRYERDNLRDAARRQLAEAIAGMGDPSPHVEIRRDVVEGGTARVLTRAGAGAELLVVGARGRGGFAGLRLGSVSRAVLHHAPCPVAVVRAHPG